MRKTEELDKIISEHIGREGPMLPILHAAQAAFGCIDDDIKRQIAEALNLSRAEVHGVVSFYHDFTDRKAPLPIIKLCEAEACQARGSTELSVIARDLAKSKCTIETIYCLGLCSVGPAAMAQDKVYARLDEASIAILIEEMQ